MSCQEETRQSFRNKRSPLSFFACAFSTSFRSRRIFSALEIGGERQANFCRYLSGPPSRANPRRRPHHARVLPDDGVVDGHSGAVLRASDCGFTPSAMPMAAIAGELQVLLGLHGGSLTTCCVSRPPHSGSRSTRSWAEGNLLVFALGDGDVFPPGNGSKTMSACWWCLVNRARRTQSSSVPLQSPRARNLQLQDLAMGPAHNTYSMARGQRAGLRSACGLDIPAMNEHACAIPVCVDGSAWQRSRKDSRPEWRLGMGSCARASEKKPWPLPRFSTST